MRLDSVLLYAIGLVFVSTVLADGRAGARLSDRKLKRMLVSRDSASELSVQKAVGKTFPLMNKEMAAGASILYKTAGEVDKLLGAARSGSKSTTPASPSVSQSPPASAGAPVPPPVDNQAPTAKVTKGKRSCSDETA